MDAEQDSLKEASNVKTLGRFGHHPDPALDFCVEVEEIQGLVYDVKIGMAKRKDVEDRIFRAMMFNPGLSPAVDAKRALRMAEAELLQA